MKIAVCLAALFAVTVVADASQYGYTRMGTNMVFDANTTNAINGGAITLTKVNDVAIWLNVKSAGTATDACSLTLKKSCDGVFYDAAVFATMGEALIANTNACTGTNITVGAIGYLQLGTFINASSNVVTVAVYAYQKPTREGYAWLSPGQTDKFAEWTEFIQSGAHPQLAQRQWPHPDRQFGKLGELMDIRRPSPAPLVR
jgi:hypothetical protein